MIYPILIQHLRTVFILFSISFLYSPLIGQSSCECAYPVIFMHGWTGNSEDWSDIYEDNDMTNIFGNFDTDDHVFWAMPNATDTHDYYQDCCTALCLFNCTYHNSNDDINGPDGVFDGNATDDDVQWVFPNEDNVLLPGCMYAYSFSVGKNNDGTIFKNPLLSSISPCDDCSDNNEAAATKQGYALKQTIAAVLAANPTKDKVILVAHSMGGLAAREYLQRTDNNGNPRWWIDANTSDGHCVKKLVTLGTPHRGSNTLELIKPDGDDVKDQKLNTVPNFSSCALRDLRYNYDYQVPALFLYGGLESSITNDYDSYDVNCDGDEDDMIIGLNISGVDQGYSDVWDGTVENPNMPLPTNIKYSYYVSDFDGLVSDRRMWLYMNGDGETSSYNNGNSIPVPHDGMDYRLSDRINGSLTHGAQRSALSEIIKMLDEGDYPIFGWDIDPDIWYFGLAQQRADKVPLSSEYTGSGDNKIDGDWFIFELTDTVYQMEITVTPHPNLSGKMDFYASNPGDYDNINIPDATLNWVTGTTSNQVITSFVDNYLPGEYYVRITHDLNTANIALNDVWKTPYKLKINSVDECIANLYIPGNQDNALYKVANTITSDATILSNNFVEYRAGNFIDLLPGFNSLPDADFHGHIKPCNSYFREENELLKH